MVIVSFIIGAFVGAIVGVFTMALCAISGRESQDEEKR